MEILGERQGAPEQVTANGYYRRSDRKEGMTSTPGIKHGRTLESRFPHRTLSAVLQNDKHEKFRSTILIGLTFIAIRRQLSRHSTFHI